MKKFFLFSITCFVLFSSVVGQTLNDFEKPNKELIKTIKKQNGLKKVEAQEDLKDYRYYLLTGKDKRVGIADLSGKVTIPAVYVSIEHYNDVYFIVTDSNNKRGLVDLNGNVIIKTAYSSIKQCRLPSGAFYFEVSDNSHYIGVLNSLGEELIPTQYGQIIYYPGIEEGHSDILLNDQNDVMHVFHKQYPPVYLATEGMNGLDKGKYSIYSEKGKLLHEGYTKSIQYFAGYFIIGASVPRLDKVVDTPYAEFKQIVNYSDLASSSPIGIISMKGDVLVKPECISVKIESEDYWNFRNPQNRINATACIYKKYIESIETVGGVLLNDTANYVPCCFDDVFYYGDGRSKKIKWSIMKTGNSGLEDYVPNKDYSHRYRDKGEEYYEKRKYDDVITFYAEEGISAPWAKYFSGISLIAEARSNFSYANMCSESIEKNDGLYNNLKERWRFDLNLAMQQFNTGIKLLEVYLQEDSTYSSYAKFHINDSKKYLSEIPEAQKRYDHALALLKQRNEEARLAEIQRQKAAQQRQNEVMAAILNGFVNALSNNFNQGNSSSRSASGRYTPSASHASSSSTSSGSNASKIAEWQSRKDSAERMLARYKEDLKRDPNSATLKREIRSQEDQIRMCDENISRLKSGY